MDQLVLGETKARAGNAGYLIGEAADVDFDPPLGLVIKRNVLEAVDVEIAFELAVDALAGG